MTPFDVPLWFLLPYLFLVGAVLGSFLNVCIYRIPRHEDLRSQLTGLWSPPSHCPRCRHRIPLRDNVPILGWLRLRGRCRFCRGRISPRYPLIELFNGLLFVIVYWAEIPFDADAAAEAARLATPLGPQMFAAPHETAFLFWRYAYHMVLLEALLVASMIDIDLRIIPDGSTLPAMLIGVVAAFASGRLFLVPVWFQEPGLVRTLGDFLPAWLVGLTDLGDAVSPAWIAEHPHWHGLAVSVAGLVVGGGLVWVVRIIGQWTLRQEAMGFGDVILMALIGSYLGWQPTIVVFFLAPVCALAVVALAFVFRRQREIPYGPYLSAAALLLLAFWPSIWPIAERFFSIGPLLAPVAVAGVVSLAASLMLMQFVKRLLGIPLAPPQEEWIEEWTSADQLTFFAGESVDHQQGRWRSDEWPGIAAGRGTLHEQRWKHGGTPGALPHRNGWR
ncbi:MAG: prepilin peptidase [Planctomycetaceae bacterium]